MICCVAPKGAALFDTKGNKLIKPLCLHKTAFEVVTRTNMRK
jgi:hypothetical protein